MDLITCPSSKQISEYLRGKVDGPQAEQLSAHIKSCSRCLAYVARPEHLARPEENEGTVAVSDIDLGLEWASPLSDDIETYTLDFLAPAVGPDELGWIANYKVLQVLGEGGMGMVLLAEDSHLQRPIALKVMKPEITIYPDARDRFMREAKAMAQLKNEHVVTIYQVGEFNNICFIAMELLEGEPLDSYISRVPKPPLREALRIGREIAMALMAAHTKGLIHRDIKPENIWLEAPNGRVKLLDFGLARPQVVNEKLTMTGQIMGTPSYMSPEQANAKEIDERSDLWSLGCMLYQLLSGHKAFDAPTLMSTLLAIFEHNPALPTEYDSTLPAAVDELVLRILAKDREKRFQKASEVIEFIAAIEKTLPADLETSANEQNKSALNRSGTISGAFSKFGSQLSVDREAERRHLSLLVLGSDLFGSDDFLDLEDEAREKILSMFANACRETSIKYGGTIVQCNDEHLLVCFGYPTACEESTILAARCALALLESLAQVNKNLADQYGFDLNPRCGLHSGLAVVEIKGKEISLVGDAKKAVLRITDLASDWQVVCSDAAHRMLRGRFDSEDLGQIKKRGVSQPISLFHIKAEQATPEPASQAVAAGNFQLVGRDLEINLLKDRWEQAREGMGQIVLLGGEAGVGKSFIVQAIKQHVEVELGSEAGESTIEWFCSPHFRNTAMHPAVAFIEHLLKFERDDSCQTKYQRLVTFLEKYDLAGPETVPVYTALLGLSSCDKFPSLELTPAKEREEIFRALTDLLRAVASKQALLFVVEDLHWIDDSTMQFLEHLFVDGLSEPILILLTFRPEFRINWPMQGQQTSIMLNRLTRQQAGELVRKKAGRALPEAVVSHICERAGGVPLFIEEFTKLVDDSGLLEQTDSQEAGVKTLMGRAIPATLQEIIIARLDRLKGDISLAQLAATIGRTFSYEVLLEISGMPAETLTAELAKLVNGDILFEKGRAPKSTYVFKHVLFQDALYNAMVKAKRRQFHQRIAENMETRNEAAGDVVSEILAHHLTGAGLIEKSIAHWHAAGMRSLEQYALTEAISHLKTGLEMLNSLPETSDRDNSELLLLNPLGSAYQAAFGYSAPLVGPVFARARQLCQKVGQPSQIFGIMWGNWTWHLVQGELALCMQLADEMMEFAAGTGDGGMLMEAHVAPAVTRFYRGDFAGCAKYCKEAILHYENSEQCSIWASRLGQNAAVVIRCYLAIALWHLGYADTANQVLDEMLSLARQCKHPFSLGHALHFAGWFYQHCQLPDKLLPTADEQIVLATQKGFALWLATGTFLKGAGIVLTGKNQDGLQTMINGMRLFKAANAAITLAAQLGVMADTLIKVGSYDEARQALNDGLALADKYEDRYQEAELHRINGELILAQAGGGAELANAEKSFRRALEIAHNQQSRAWELRSALSLARLLDRQGRAEEGRKQLEAIYGRFTEGFALPEMQEAKALLKA